MTVLLMMVLFRILYKRSDRYLVIDPKSKILTLKDPALCGRETKKKKKDIITGIHAPRNIALSSAKRTSNCVTVLVKIVNNMTVLSHCFKPFFYPHCFKRLFIFNHTVLSPFLKQWS